MDESERLTALEKQAAVSEERFANILEKIEANTQAVRDLTTSISDYPVTRERVANMWKIVCGLLAMTLASIASAIGILIKGA